MSGGSPLRPDRNSFGAVMLDRGAVRDPQRDLSAQYWNLAVWQLAGLGLLAPRVGLQFTLSGTPAIISRAESWNPMRSTTGSYADPSFTVNGVGDVTVAWPTAVPDDQGNIANIAFAYAQAFVVNTDPSVVKKAQAAPILAHPYQIRVCAFNAANTLEDGNAVVVFGW